MKLRAVTLADGDALHALFTEPGVRRYLFDDILLTREQTQEHVAAATGHDAWLICENDVPVGFVSLRPTGNDVELMIAISERAWGRSLAFEAARAAMRHGFDVLNRRRILASVDVPNERSHRLMQRLGFAATGEVDGPLHRLRTYEAQRQ